MSTLSSFTEAYTDFYSVLFFISTALQFLLGKAHKKDQRYGPGPSNNYTSGTSEKKFWQRNRAVRDPEIGAHTTNHNTHLVPGAHDVRPSHDTAYTGTTVDAPHSAYENPNKPAASGYHTAPLTHNAYNSAPNYTTGTATNY